MKISISWSYFAMVVSHSITDREILTSFMDYAAMGSETGSNLSATPTREVKDTREKKSLVRDSVGEGWVN